ncbi:hypothetical protein BDZ45DRAFT_800797 [Acephala macrosclerotiorum]|nr:hypothetical protein BDZ45DRAFT_800797 [Acephala macrosclerotiorum]
MAANQVELEVQLERMPQLTEAVDKEDNWTGLTDAAARRKRQNRLNVRAFLTGLRRPHKYPKHTRNPTSLLDRRPTNHLSHPRLPYQNRPQDPRTPLLPYFPTSSNAKITTEIPRIIFPLSSDHLITLIQFNVLRATLTNLHLLSLLQTIPYECSLALSIAPSSSHPLSIPPSLQPTSIQSSIPHDPWIDIIPSPQWRDNLILAQGMYDLDDLCCDMAGGLWEGFPDGDANCTEKGIVAWNTPWDVGGWEISRGFWRKWGRLILRGCGDVLQATNGWRRQRGEKELRWEDLGLGAEA